MRHIATFRLLREDFSQDQPTHLFFGRNIGVPHSQPVARRKHRNLHRQLHTAEWLYSQMAAHGLAPSEPKVVYGGYYKWHHLETWFDRGRSVEFRYCINGKMDGREFRLVIAPCGVLVGPADGLMIMVDRNYGPWPAWLEWWGRPDKGRQRTTLAIHKILSSSPEVSDLQWWTVERASGAGKGGKDVP